ncbi:Hypothetical Protein RSKD131_2236 [Cereibacter sphaeroides KD131]|nr:Hypothetical Protein RSKD131_2236 [Cereibacter sphaeroides KD131]
MAVDFMGGRQAKAARRLKVGRGSRGWRRRTAKAAGRDRPCRRCVP